MGRRKQLGIRVRRELATVTAMVRLFCSEHHAAQAADCPHCAELLSYAGERLERCPFGEDKATCANCAVHCYRPEMRDRIRSVMRYAGPRMLLRHPLLAVHHMLDEKREPPPLVKRPAPAPAPSRSEPE